MLTFLPVVITDPAVASVVLLTDGAVAAVSQLAAGCLGNRYGPQVLLLPSLALAAAGSITMAFAERHAAFDMLGAALFGAGFGPVENASLALMLQRAAVGHETARVSTMWNVAYDAGMGAGAVLIGLLSARTGYRAGLLTTAALIIGTAILRGERRRVAR
jgi:predicted MFS family arabinose efflux permease